MWIFSVLDALEKSRVRYALVGGYAVALHGAVRGTVDLDIILEISEESFVAAERTLLKLGLQSRLPVSGSEVFRYRKEYREKRNLIAWSFWDAQDPTRVVDVIITEDLKGKPVKTITVKGHKIRILGVEALIEMKRASGRPQDLEDIRALKEIARGQTRK